MDGFTLHALMRRDKHVAPLFEGVFAADTLPADSTRVALCSYTKQTSFQKPGTHWVAFFIDKHGVGEYWDSYGMPPIVSHHKNFLKRLCKKWTYNHTSLQAIDSKVCGEYCLLYLIHRAHGYTLHSFVHKLFTSNPLKNDEIVRTLFKPCLLGAHGNAVKCQERDSNQRIADLRSAALDHSAILTSLDTQCTEGLLSQDGDLAQESAEYPEVSIDVASQNDSVVSLAQFYQRLEYKHIVLASVTQVVAEEMKRVCLDFKSDFLTNLSSVLESEKLSTETISDILSAMTLRCDMLQICHTLRNSYMRKVYFRKNFRFVEPIKVPLKSGSFFYYVPIKETIKAAFDNKCWNFSMNGFPFSPTGLLRDFYDGEVFRNNSFIQENPTSIVIILYQDGFELACPLGPAKNLKHKIVGIYMAFGNLPSEVRFKKDSIQLVGHVKQCDFSHEEVYGFIVSHIIKLQENGVNLPGFGNRRVQLAYIAGDNLGSHSLGGFVENFSRSEYFCRFCLINRKAFCKQGGEVRRFKRRTKESYNDAFPRVTVHPTTGIITAYQGVKFNSEFNDVNDFHVCSPGLPSCLGHDLAEGVICYDLKLFIKYFISEGWFDIDELNYLIDSFPHSVEDMKDRPPIIKKKRKKGLAGGAWQLITFLRLFPLILFGRIDDPNDAVWKCLLLLRDIAAFCVAPEVPVSHLPALQCLIDEYLVTRRHLFPTVPLRCKHHYLTHYCEQFISLGPLVKCFTLRFESKHCFFTRSWKSSNNSINILQTLSYKHEYLQSWVRSGGGILCETETGPRSPLVSSMYASSVVNALSKKIPSLQCEVCDHVKVKGTAYRKGDVVIL
ncbi:LOW QUALITY PROTEIN: Putative thiol protease R355 [Frankliniella fusca]|uniref:Thiol protease R355 n=1 Tax=Frankliniella fusca TaxID=407009 RepID=A0AAE1HAV2_9NEOP|nr:LOW QUALITY PROTEIN: Putative thiol protease R355 [Frankliniella fusca]